MISVFVPGVPKPQPRPRAFARRVGDKTFVRAYDPGTAEAWKTDIAAAFRPYLPPTPIDGHVELDILFYFPRPARLLTKRANDGDIPHTSRPDLDNLAKAVMDCLTTLGVWRDDSLISRLHLRKNFAPKNGVSGAQITVFEEVK